MQAGKNVWVCDELQGCGHEFRSEILPQECPKCGFYMVRPKINPKRIHDSRYEYYHEDSDWERAANNAMKSMANQNFRKN